MYVSLPHNGCLHHGSGDSFTRARVGQESGELFYAHCIPGPHMVEEQSLKLPLVQKYSARNKINVNKVQHPTLYWKWFR